MLVSLTKRVMIARVGGWRQTSNANIVKGKRRCRMHGGAYGSGAPRGKRNGNYRHGFYTAEAIAERRAVRALIRELAS
jgi:hypothetical protein